MMEDLDQVALRVPLYVDEQVAAGDQVEPGEGIPLSKEGLSFVN
jgi:hypothetical protein